jgi:plasmid stabilization system protein ParE
MRLERSAFIEGDLDEIAEHIAKDNPRRAVTFIHDIRTKFRDIARHPLIYQLRPEINENARLPQSGITPFFSGLTVMWCVSSAWPTAGATCRTCLSRSERPVRRP